MWSLECKHQMLTDDARRTTHVARRTTTDDGQPLTTIAHHEHFVLRWAKKSRVCHIHNLLQSYQYSKTCTMQNKKLLTSTVRNLTFILNFITCKAALALPNISIIDKCQNENQLASSLVHSLLVYLKQKINRNCYMFKTIICDINKKTMEAVMHFSQNDSDSFIHTKVKCFLFYI